MKILSVSECISEIIETDNEEWPIYRRYSGGGWENLMGCSWEECYDDDLEKAYQEFKNNIV